MKKRGMFLKRKIAAFLALSMVIGSVPTGGLLTAEAAGREKTGRAELIRFDREKLRERAREAAESRKMTAPPRVAASCSDALEFQDDSYELKDADSLLAEGTSLPEDTRLRVFLSPDEAGYEENDGGELDYTMTGNENLVFMVENESEEMRGYQLVFGNQITDVVTVKSKSQLLREYEAGLEEETATPSDAEEILETQPAAGAEEAGSQTGEAGAETGAPQETEEEPSSEAESQGEEAKETGASQEEEAAAKDEAGEGIEIETEDTAEEGEQASKVHLLGSLGRFLTGSIEAQAQTLPASPSTALPETETARESQEEAAAPKLPDAGAEEAATPSDALAEENPDADGYIRLSSAVISGSVLVYSTQERVDAPQEIKPRMLLHEYGEDEDQAKPKKSNTRAVALVTVPYGDLFAAGGTDNGIRVNLYDYSVKEGQNPDPINQYLQKNGVGAFKFGGTDSAEMNRYSYESGFIVKETHAQNIYQEILDDSRFGEKGTKLLENLFPDSEKTFEETHNGIQTYLDVDTTGFFEVDEGNLSYKYDSNEFGAKLTDGCLIKQDRDGNGFWPLGYQNFFFGMSMTFDFYKPENGEINGRAMKFNFSGDDDVWVFITNKETGQRALVLDMGGIHGDMEGSINFKTGEIIYSIGEGAKDSERDDRVIYNPIEGLEQDRWENKYIGNAKDLYKGLIDFDKAGNYRLEFYYLERGAGDSNCKLKFNLPVVPSQGIKLSKQITADEDKLEELKKKQYSFEVVYSKNLEDLKNYRESGEGNADTARVVLTGPSSQTIEEVEAGDYFYFVEHTREGVSSIAWASSEPAAGGTEPAEQGVSPIYQLPQGEDEGVLITCTNQYGGLNPELSKKANIREDGQPGAGEGVYDISLSVTGDEITTAAGGEETKPLDVVIVVDKSNSMNDYDFSGVKEKIKGFAELLDGTCKMKVIAFGSDRFGTNLSRDYPDYEQSGTEYYEEVTSWLPMDEGGKKQLDRDLQKLRANENTHSAAGFWGARNALNEEAVRNDGAEKAVIYLTDGEPNTYVDRIKVDLPWGGEIERGIFYEPGDEKRALEKAEDQMAKLTATDAKVYTIAYGDYEAESWLSKGADGYFSANDTTQLEEVLKRIAQSIKPSVSKVTHPVVTDQLSQAVEIYNGVEKEGWIGPRLYLGQQELNDVTVEKGELVYALEGQKIAVYDPSAKTITWFVADSLGKEDTRTLTFAVRAVGAYEADPSQYPDKGMAGTGTHSEEKGYFSNAEANLTFKGGRKEFPKPVVRPVQQEAAFTLKKSVEGGPENWFFEFKIGFSQEVEALGDGIPDSNGWYYYTVDLTDDVPEQTVMVPVGIQYTVSEEEWESDGYKQTGTVWEVNGDTLNGKTPGGTVEKNGVSIMCTNIIGQYQYITVEKRVADQGGAAPQDAVYFFKITDRQGKAAGEFALKEGESKKIQIEPEYKAPFTITETDTQGAWKTESVNKSNNVSGGAVIEKVSSNDTVIFTNYFYEHDIVLEKQVDGREPDETVEYPFTVKLKVAEGTALRQEDIAVADGKTGEPVEVREFKPLADDSEYNYQFTVALDAGQSIRIDNLPQSVTGYEIGENLGQIQVPGYDLQIEEVTVNGEPLGEEAENTVRVSYDSETPVDQQDQIVFTNQYTAQLGQLQIEKELITGAASEDVSFVFKITGENTGKSFYATVTVKQGSSKGTSHILTVPAGAYVIEEVSSSIQYQPAGDSVQKVKVEPDGATAMVTFENQKTGGGYFTDASSVVNQVDEEGFHMETSGEIKPLESALQKAGPFKKPDPVPEAEDGAEQPEV